MKWWDDDGGGGGDGNGDDDGGSAGDGDGDGGEDGDDGGNDHCLLHYGPMGGGIKPTHKGGLDVESEPMMSYTHAHQDV